MPSKKQTVQLMNQGILGDHDILLGSSRVKRLKIPTNTPITLSFGSANLAIRIVPQAKLSGIRISRNLAHQLGITSKASLRFRYRPSSRVLKLGPLIGVLVSRAIPDSPDRPFGNITSFCQEMANACQKQGAYVYFITPSDIENFSTNVRGWVYSGGWRQTELPIANVYYNRLTSRKLENKPSVQHFMKEVKSRYGSHFINEKYLDKTEVFSALQSDASVQRYLPESYPFVGASSLKTMLSKYPVVFLKPIKGSLGKGIIRIIRLSDGAYVTHLTQTTGLIKQKYESLSKLSTAMTAKMKNTRYQIQQGLSLIEVGRRPVDFRALVQKNAQGQWAITSVVARIAGSKHFVSNLARGGSLCPAKEAIARSSLPSGIKNKIELRLRKAALRIAQGVDESIPAHFGELGIDLAIDSGGRIWLLEVNSKPSKNDNTPLGDNKIRPSVRRFLDYACYLSGF